MTLDRQCRICGCTDISACVDPNGEPCCWNDDDLCSVCANGLQPLAIRWARQCFSEDVVESRLERGLRVFEEAGELLQLAGGTAEDAHRMVDYVFSRPAETDPYREIGGVLVSLAVLCDVFGVDLEEAWEREMARCIARADEIRAKQAAKPAGIAVHAAAETLFETQYADWCEEGWLEPVSAPNHASAAILQAQHYIAETDAFDPKDQPFTDTILVRERKKPGTVQAFDVTGRIAWTATPIEPEKGEQG